jgi:GNAT superfamily N-acetyltransferase
MEIKPLSIEDLPYVSSIMQTRWGVDSKWADKEAKRFLVADKNTAGFCVHDNKKTIGVGLFDLHNDDVSKDYGPWLYLLWVDPKYRGHNLGVELTKKRMEHARKHGYTEVYLDTTDALEYHKKLGWEYVCTVNYEGEVDRIMKSDLTKDFPRFK